MTEEEDLRKRKAIMNRIAKVIGHTKSVKGMVERGQDCSEVLIQLAAVKSALNNTGKEILKDYLNESLQEAVATGDEEKLKELNRVIENFLK